MCSTRFNRISLYGLEHNEETKDVASYSANKEDENDQEVNGDQDKVENYYWQRTNRVEKY